MDSLSWNVLKNKRLKKTRGVSFEELVSRGRLIDVRQHPARMLQNVLLFEYRNYVWVVPFVTDGGELFLKTLYPSRKYTKLLKKGKL